MLIISINWASVLNFFNIIRYPALASVLRAIEALSMMYDYSEGMCSNKEVLQMAMELIKIPEKLEVNIEIFCK